MTPLLRAALRYAGHGWPVLPVNGKVPLTPRGVLDASVDADQVRAWWSRWPGANLAYAVREDHVVVDLDREEGLQALKSAGYDLPATGEVKTGRGRHFYYQSAGEVCSRVGVVPGVDLRAAGSYVVVPPSVHASGAVYQWSSPPRDIAPAPSWVYEAGSPTTGGGGDLRTVLVEPVTRGQRNHVLARWAGVCVRHLPAAVAVDAVRWLNASRFSPPLSDGEVDRVLASIMRRELRRRGEVPNA